MLDSKKEELYLDYFNNFLSVGAFAEHYNLEISEAEKIIKEGREINHNK